MWSTEACEPLWELQPQLEIASKAIGFGMILKKGIKMLDPLWSQTEQ